MSNDFKKENKGHQGGHEHGKPNHPKMEGKHGHEKQGMKREGAECRCDCHPGHPHGKCGCCK